MKYKKIDNLTKYFLIRTSAIILVLSEFIFPAFANSSDAFLLNKDSILKEALNGSATIEKIRATSLSASFDKSQFLETFQPQLEGNANYFKTNEERFISFAPITSPISNLSLGVKKDFITGMSLEASNKFRKSKVESFGNDVKNSVALEFKMDLYKDFFGKDSKSRLSYFEYEDQIAKIKKDIDQEIFLITLHRIYSSIILNQEAINISNKILGIYQKQEADARKRYKNGIADLSEVSRRSAQVSSKEVIIFNLTNNKENLILSLKKLLPSIANREVQLADYDFTKEIEYFSKITKDIENQKEIPMQYTYYDEVINLIEKSYQKQKKFTNNYSDVNVEFYSAYEHFGKNKGIRKTIDKTYKSAQDSYEIGLRFNVPLGKTKADSEKLQLSLKKANFLAKKSENLAKIEAQHTQSIRSLKLLKQAIVFQEKNSKNLKNILKISEQKYQQARIPIRDLIEDQDFYLQSLLSEIEVKMLIINQIYDYLEIFTNTPFSLSNTMHNG